MGTFRHSVMGLGAVLVVAACATASNPMDEFEQLTPASQLQAPDAPNSGDFPAAQVARGQYLVSLLGCGSCHTDGALIGEPDSKRLLAGSQTGIAYSNPLVQPNPGIVYPANLTPDRQTGIGNRSVEQLVTLLRAGTDRHGSQILPVMPWPAYAYMTADDAAAIATYLKSLSPVRHQVPANVPPGQPASAPFVHFGVYRSRP